MEGIGHHFNTWSWDFQLSMYTNEAFLLSHYFHIHEKSFHAHFKGSNGRSIHLLPAVVLEKAQATGGLRCL